jgi:hypothetical protein
VQTHGHTLAHRVSPPRPTRRRRVCGNAPYFGFLAR